MRRHYGRIENVTGLVASRMLFILKRIWSFGRVLLDGRSGVEKRNIEEKNHDKRRKDRNIYNARRRSNLSRNWGKFGVTKQCIEQILHPSDRKRVKISQQCIYSGLSQYIEEQKLTYGKLADIFEIKSVPSIRRKILGITQLKINEIEKILEITGMTFEECFKKNAPEAGTSKGKSKQ